MQGVYSTVRRCRRWVMLISAAAALTTPLLVAQAAQAPGSSLDQLRSAGKIRLGYRTAAQPFAYMDQGGQAAGYSVALCQMIAADVQKLPGLAGARVDWIPVTVSDRFAALEQGRIDVLCGAETASLERRAHVSFSIPIFAGGLGAVVRADAPAAMRDVLSGRAATYHPTWRAAAAQVLKARAFSAVQGTTADTWLTARIRDLQVIAAVSPVTGYDTGVQAVLDRKSDAFFGERAVLLDLARRHQLSHELTVLDRQFTYEPLALGLARGDEDLRLIVDRTLSRLYTSGEIGAVYAKWFGAPDESTLTFLRWATLPD